jgi:hypothetical protein
MQLSRCLRASSRSRVVVHRLIGLGVVAVAAGASIAAIVGLFRPHLLPAVRTCLRVAIAAIALEVVVGIVLVATGSRPQQSLHWLYGAATLLTLPLAIFVGRRLGGRDERVWLAGGAVLTVLFVLRALATG